MNVQTPCSQKRRESALFSCTLDKVKVQSRERRMNPKNFTKLNNNANKTKETLGIFLGEKKKTLINAYQEVAELFITSALLSICSCYLVSL